MTDRDSRARYRGLRDYLLAGGFLVVDDFWGTREWESFAEEMRKVFPEFELVVIYLIMFIVLMLKPEGLFGAVEVRRI